MIKSSNDKKEIGPGRKAVVKRAVNKVDEEISNRCYYKEQCHKEIEMLRLLRPVKSYGAHMRRICEGELVSTNEHKTFCGILKSWILVRVP